MANVREEVPPEVREGALPAVRWGSRAMLVQFLKFEKFGAVIFSIWRSDPDPQILVPP